MSLSYDNYLSGPQNTMLRHADNCTGENTGDENGTLTPKKARRGRKRKMQTRRDDDDDDDDDDDTGNVYISFCFLQWLSLFYKKYTMKQCLKEPFVNER